MNMILRQLGRFKKDALLCIGMTTLEVAMDILLPFITAIIIDRGLEQANLPTVYRYGALMVVMAFLGLVFAALAGKAHHQRFFHSAISSKAAARSSRL